MDNNSRSATKQKKERNMLLKCLGSSSAGNCYIIQDEEEALIIECGINISKIKQALNFNVGKVSGLIISHAHGDHCKYVSEAEKIFPVFTIKSVIEAKELKRTTEVFPEKGFMAGNFKILPFHAAHDIPCVGYLINHSKTGNIMFLTDSFLCDYTFSNLSHILIEANYSDACIDESVLNGLHWKVKERVMTSHMELKTTKKVLLNQNLTNVHNVVLLHLSGQNSDPAEFFEVIAKATGKPITIAKPGVEIELIKNPY